MSDDTDTRLTVVEQRLDLLNDAVEDLERENSELRRQVAALQSEVDPDPGSKEYSDLSRAEKVRQIRERLVDVAGADHNGTAAMKYKDVMWLFDGHPSWLIVQIPTNDSNSLESKLHDEFKQRWVTGEWYDLSPDEYDILVDMMRMAQEGVEFDSIESFKQKRQQQSRGIFG